MNELELYYTKKIESAALLRKTISGKLLLGSLGRLLFFLMMFFAVYELFKNFDIAWVVFLVTSLAGFLGMISWFVNLKTAEQYQLQLKNVFENELQCIQGKSNGLDNGASLDTGESFWADLDLFGPGSVYQALNRTATYYGQQALSQQLKYPSLEKGIILEHQKAIQAYSQQMPLVESVITTAILHQSGQAGIEPVFEWLDTPNYFHKNSWAKFIRFAWPIFNGILLVMALIKGNAGLLGISFLIGLAQVSFYGKYLQPDFTMLGKKEAILNQYAAILRKFELVDAGDSALLAKYQKTAKQAHRAIRELSKISSRIDQRLNLFVILVFNPYFLYDIQNMFSLESWKIKYRHELKDWIDTVGEIEKLNSLATYAFQNKENSYPVVLSGGMQIVASGLKHPLIQKQLSVGNDLSIGIRDKLLLITGSNMSGKTTFLRTVAVNIVMAQAGMPVCADAFSFTPLQIFSSIRVSDSLQESTSYFMAELKKLKSIKTGVQQSQASLVLIDEILRGTNSDDKYYGSEQFVKEMIRYNCLTLFATHDLKLSELENEYPAQVANYCFESSIENNELLFDYRMRRGVAKNKNASFLMKKMGII